MTKCPQCGSTKVFRYRLDSDWAHGIGDYYPVNDRAEYTSREWDMNASDAPDIEIYHCLYCDHLWE